MRDTTVANLPELDAAQDLSSAYEMATAPPPGQATSPVQATQERSDRLSGNVELGVDFPWPAAPHHRVSIVIPAMNEAESLPHVLRRIPTWVHEVILVDGHSVDDTLRVAREGSPGIRIIVQEGKGKGAALRPASTRRAATSSSRSTPMARPIRPRSPAFVGR